MNSKQIMKITVLVNVTLVVWLIDNIVEESGVSNFRGKPMSWDGKMYGYKETDGCALDPEWLEAMQVKKGEKVYRGVLISP